MTKNVEQYSSTWLKMKSALASLTGGSGSYSTSSYGGPSSGASHAGFKRDIDQLVSISESAKKLIQERDSDGVVSFHYHDERQTAQSLQGKLESLEKYAGNVSTYLKNRIDQPFYKAIDGVGAKLEALSIASYKTSNTIGYQRTDVVKDVYGNPMGTQKVTPKEIGLEELYRVDNPYKKTLQASYQDFKNSKTYKDHKLTETEFLMASHHTRAFNYESIRDQQEAIEMWRDLAIGGGLLLLGLFCPPAGGFVLAASLTMSAADMYSALSGRDWGTGRELDPTERGLRGFFALIDLVPGGISLIKGGKGTGKLVGKQLLKEGAEQGAHTIDDGLKTLAKFGDNVLKQVDNFGSQGDQLLNKLIASSADQLSAGLKTIDGTISQAAQNFRLNMGLEPQLVSGAIPSPGSSSINKISNKLDDFSKARKLRVSNLDEVGEQITRLDEVTVSFNRNPKHDETEFVRQLKNQEEGMNKLTVQEYLDNRARYLEEGRALEGDAAQLAARKEALTKKYQEFVRSGMSRDEAKIKAEEWLKTQAALHNPDQIAGGNPLNIGGMGDTRINSSLGSQWKYRIDVVDEQIRNMAAQMTPQQLQTTYLNVRLTY